MTTVHHVSERQACDVLKLNRSSYQYVAKEKDDTAIIDELNQLIEKHPSIGFWMCYYRLRQKGYLWNHKHIYRIYTAMRLNKRRRTEKRLPARVKQQLFQPLMINEVWSIDFMHDSLWDGRCYRLLNYNR